MNLSERKKKYNKPRHTFQIFKIYIHPKYKINAFFDFNQFRISRSYFKVPTNNQNKIVKSFSLVHK